LRELATNVVLWNSNKSQNEKFFKEQFQFTLDKFEDLIKHTPTIHNFFILNLKYKRIFNDNWNEIKWAIPLKVERGLSAVGKGGLGREPLVPSGEDEKKTSR
jgi:hypothetical protein